MFESHWRVKDGLFVGDREASTDLEFVVENKVTRMVNCAGWSVPNSLEEIGIVYLTYNWVDAEREVILDEEDDVADEVFSFVEEALERAESVLVHSVLGQSRSCCLLNAYLMKKYRWGAQKAFEFMESRRPEQKLQQAFKRQLSSYEERLKSQAGPPLSFSWKSADLSQLEEEEEQGPHAENEELMLSNSYFNGHSGPTVELELGPNVAPFVAQKLSWADGMAGDKLRLERPASPAGKAALKTVLKARSSVMAGGAGMAASRNSTNGSIEIRTRSRVVHCRKEEIVPKRFGLQYSRDTILLEYVVPGHGLRAHHPIRVDMGAGAGKTDRSTAEHLRRTHAPWLDGVTVEQLAGLIGRLRGGSSPSGSVTQQDKA